MPTSRLAGKGVLLVGGAAALGSVAVWAIRDRNHPSVCPYSLRFFLALRRPFMRRETLLGLLAPVPGE